MTSFIYDVNQILIMTSIGPHFYSQLYLADFGLVFGMSPFYSCFLVTFLGHNILTVLVQVLGIICYAQFYIISARKLADSRSNSLEGINALGT